MKVQALDRAFDILELLSKEQNGLNLTDIGHRLGLHKSTVHRLLGALKERGYIEQQAPGSYRLGMELIELSSLFLNNLELKTEAQPVLRELTSLTGNTVFLATHQEDQVVYIDKMETFNSLRKYSIIGTRAPLYCTALGKAMLSGKPDAEIRGLFRGKKLAAFTPATLTGVEEILREIARTRKRGWSIDDQEYEPGLRCIGAPIWDYRSQVIAAVSTSGSVSMIPEHESGRLADCVKKAALDISRRMGYRGP